MSYVFELVHLPAGIDPADAYEKLRREKERSSHADGGDPGPLAPAVEDKKRKLVASLLAKNPGLKLFDRNYAAIAQERSITESEARRLFRNLQLNDNAHSTQIEIFDDEAGVAFSFDGTTSECTKAFHLLWDCLQILETEGSFSVYDAQLARVLDLREEFSAVLKKVCGSNARSEPSSAT